MRDEGGVGRVVELGDSALLMQFGELIDVRVNERVVALGESLVREPLPAQVDVVPAYASVAIAYDPVELARLGIDRRQLAAMLEERAATAVVRTSEGRVHEIAVCYDRAVALDLDHVAEHAGVSADEVIAIHGAAEYRVFMIGFTPGFPYLGGLDPRLAMPRRDTPRERVPAGSVAIGGEQTGIYPMASPGGWWIVGRTPATLFDPTVDPPTLLSPGDRIRFRSIPLAELERLTREGNSR